MKRTGIVTVVALLALALWARAEMLLDDGNDQEQSRPAMAVAQQRVYVAFQDTSAFDYDVRMTVSNDGGATFEPSALVHPPNTQVQWQPHLATGPSGEAYVVWADWKYEKDFDIYLASTADGVDYSVPVRVNDVPRGTQITPRVAVNPAGDVFVVWSDNRDSTAEDYGVRWDVYLARSTDGGASFEPSLRLSQPEYNDEPYFALNADVAAPSEDAVLVAWLKCSWSLGNIRLRFGSSDDGGDAFAPPLTLDAGSFALGHRIAADADGRALVVWEDGRESGAGADPTLVFGSGRTLDVYALYSDDFGNTWSAPFRVNEQVRLNQQRPEPALTPGGWAVVWSDDRDVGDYTIRLATESWPPSGTPVPGIKVDGYAGLAERTYPDLAWSPAGLFVVWQDFRDNQYDLYFERP